MDASFLARLSFLIPEQVMMGSRASHSAKHYGSHFVLPYSLAIFDFDGTLADSMAWTRSIMNQVARRFRFKQITDDEFVMLRSWDTAAIIRYLGVPAWKIPLIAAHVRRLASRDAHAIPLFEGAEQLLRTLQRWRRDPGHRQLQQRGRHSPHFGSGKRRVDIVL